MSPPGPAAPDAFADLAAFVAVPRLSGLALSPDGRRLVGVVSELDANGTHWRGALWQFDPQGADPALRLTRSAESESAPVFSAAGDLLFLSRRADPLTDPDDDAGAPRNALWCLPAAGEAHRVADPAGAVTSARAAHDADAVLLGTTVLPGATFGEQDAQRRTARKDAGVTAVLHEEYPVRYWDHDLGPDRARLVLRRPDPEGGHTLTDLVPDAHHRLGSAVLSPDGTTVVVEYLVERGRNLGRRGQLRVVHADGGPGRVLLDSPEHHLTPEVVMPDGSAVICTAERLATTQNPPRLDVWSVSLADGAVTELTAGFAYWAHQPTVAPDGSALYVVADCGGRAPIWRIDLTAPGAEPQRLTGEGAFTDLCVAPDSTTLYALRSWIDSPPRPVRITGAGTPHVDVAELGAPGAVTVPGTLTEVRTRVADGRAVRGFLALPSDTSAPAPLLVWVHGGPLSSWNSWTWRWNPWTATARGYAVLLPDPALSTGYGDEFIDVGWAAWGGCPYTDVLALTDAALERGDLDAARTALCGGSFGGYLANWTATQTDRFDAIVTHASLWNLDSFTGTTDDSFAWLAEMGDPLTDRGRIEANSPHLRVADISTPMLVIHGDKDYRVPIGEGLRLWFDLVRHEVPAKFLYFPDENHWVLTPGNAQVWYATVFAFLDHHVRGRPWERPALV